MEVIKKDRSNFGTLEIDFYLDKDRNILVTIEQLAQGFGYKNRKAVEKMVERNPYLKNKQFSVTDKLSATDGKKYETRLFTKRGIYEVGMLSRTEKGKIFRSWLYDHIEKMEEENAKFRLQRELEKPKRKTLHDSIETWELAPKHAHPTVNNLLLKGASGLNKKQLMAERGGINGIDSLTSDELVKYQALEDMAIAMINLGMSYQDIKAMVFRQKENAPQGA
ncbi:BRO family protein [uncultured Streptococcus sp.]|uniref:BRO-N domain-containing protein n=1 Tax=uncultured Streptococcus sp. TaxID=83427 RepID=UPI0027DDB196|nr:BRO family protein [uncultured Streptococcus sp.]